MGNVTSINRRQFDRLKLSEAAYAVDENGRQLGSISQASGGGIQIQVSKQAIADSLPMGRKLKVTVMEPGSQTSHTIDMVVRHVVKATPQGTTQGPPQGWSIGMEFVGAEGP